MDIEAKLVELEQRVAALEGHPERTSEHGTVTFAGDVTIREQHFTYEWIRPAEFLTDDAFHTALTRASALAHPIRHLILRRLLDGPASVTELVEEELVTSTGTAYHHLGALHSGGWVQKKGGSYQIPPSRVIPLLAIVAASEDH